VLKENLIRSCRYLLLPVIRLLLKHGITWNEFGELSKDAFVMVTRQDYSVQGRPTNNSRVAMLTGLSRREVSKIRDRLIDGTDDAEELHGNRISRILSGWHVDAEFIDAHGQPKDLPTTGPTGSLARLLKAYAGDLPHGAILKELQQRKLIEELPEGLFRVLKRDYVYAELDPEIVGRMGVALHDHAATLEHNLNEKRLLAPRFEAIADNARVSPKALQAFQKLLETEGLSFLEGIDAYLSKHEIDNNEDENARTVRLGVGVYLIYDESEQGQIK